MERTVERPGDTFYAKATYCPESGDPILVRFTITVDQTEDAKEGEMVWRYWINDERQNFFADNPDLYIKYKNEICALFNTDLILERRTKMPTDNFVPQSPIQGSVANTHDLSEYFVQQ